MAYFFWLPVGLYLVGWLFQFAGFWRGGEKSLSGGELLTVGWGSHALFLALQVKEGAGPLELLLSVVAWGLIALAFWVRRRAKGVVYGFIFPPLAVALLLVAGLMSHRALLDPADTGLDPAWRQGLLVAHILGFLAGHILFLMATLASLLYLYEERMLKAKVFRAVRNRVPSLGALEQMNERAVVAGFFFLSGGIMLGILIAGIETFGQRIAQMRTLLPMLTWAIYAGFLMERFVGGMRGRHLAVWSVTGFLVVVVSLVVEMNVLWSRG